MKILLGDCLKQLKTLEDSSVDSLITDPPAGISFMGKDWDDDKGGRDQWIAWMTDVMKECLRVMKPGAHGLVWALPRTSHWTATALENAGFEVRDVITHLFGSGFPKSHNIAKAIETAEAKQWEGWGTALKPASEHWILVRKPCSEKTVAKNVLKHGVGGINIDECRIGSNPGYSYPNGAGGSSFSVGKGTDGTRTIPVQSTQGRFPANLVLSHSEHCTDTECDQECAIKRLDEQSGILKQGGASRFFYCAKASKADKGSENTHPTVKSTKLMQYLIKLITPPNGVVLDPFMGSGSTGVAATELKFEFIGIEKEPEYHEIALKRVASGDILD